jgi:hypothetical protein
MTAILASVAFRPEDLFLKVQQGGRQMITKTRIPAVVAVLVRRLPVLVAMLAILATAFGSVAVADDREDGTVRVMTRNLYHGFDPAVVIRAPAAQIPFAAATAYQMIQASKPAERAAAVAAEIVRHRVDLVGLQEATIVRKGPLQLPPGPNFLPATEVVSDNLELLLAELKKLGDPYHVVAIVPGLDAQLPTALGFDARVTIRDAIIARSRSSHLKFSNVQVQGFLVNQTFSTTSGRREKWP